MNNNLLKNKSVIIAIVVSLFILLLVIILSPKRSVSPAPPAPSAAPQNRAGSPVLINLSAERRAAATSYVQSISGKLPLYLEGFKTSVGIDTTINIYRLDTDPPEVVRLEIYGLSYMNKDANPQKNPNVTAYRESYAKAISMIESVNVDPKKLIFVYGDKEYIRTTTGAWIDALHLHP